MAEPTTSVDTGAMSAAAAEFQKVTQEAFAAQMIVAQAQVVHQARSGVANATGQVGAQVGQDIRSAGRSH